MYRNSGFLTSQGVQSLRYINIPSEYLPKCFRAVFELDKTKSELHKL